MRSGLAQYLIKLPLSALLMAMLLLATSSAEAFLPGGNVRKGNAQYEKGLYENAQRSYEKALKAEPGSSVAAFNHGAATYMLGNYPEAIEHLTPALLSDDPTLQRDTNYNIGNAKYQAGRAVLGETPEQAASLFQDALEYYRRALALDPDDNDARYNYELVYQQLQKLKQQQKDSDEQKQGDSKDSKDGEQKESQSGQSDAKQQDDTKQQSQEAGQDQQDQQQKQGQAAGSGDKPRDEDEQKAQQQAATGDKMDMTRQEALMLLQAHGQKEQGQGFLILKKMPPPQNGDVRNDW